MQKVLRKRIWRDFKSNLPRYLALSLLIILAMYLVVSLVGAAETIIRGSENADSRQCVEDGDFSLFVPMKDEEMEDLEADGVTIEPQFYMDYEIDEDHTIRIFANRDEVNRIDLVKGTLAEKGNELVVERQFAEKNDISAGDVITFGGREFTVTGIGTTPDYDNVLKSLGDTGCDCLHFGTGFVAADVYDTLRAEEKSIKSEEYYYAYRLNGAMTDDELKDRLEKLEFTSGDVEDPFFQEYWDRTMGKKDDLTNGIQELLDGAKELKELKAFEDGIIEYTDGTKEAEDGSNELLDGIQELKDETDDMIDDIFSEDAQNLMTFVKAGDNARIQAASGDQELYRCDPVDPDLLCIISVRCTFDRSGKCRYRCVICTWGKEKESDGTLCNTPDCDHICFRSDRNTAWIFKPWCADPDAGLLQLLFPSGSGCYLYAISVHLWNRGSTGYFYNR